jgi:hypothetical protein
MEDVDWSRQRQWTQYQSLMDVAGSLTDLRRHAEDSDDDNEEPQPFGRDGTGATGDGLRQPALSARQSRAEPIKLP